MKEGVLLPYSTVGILSLTPRFIFIRNLHASRLKLKNSIKSTFASLFLIASGTEKTFLPFNSTKKCVNFEISNVTLYLFIIENCSVTYYTIFLLDMSSNLWRNQDRRVRG